MMQPFLMFFLRQILRQPRDVQINRNTPRQLDTPAQARQ